MGDGQQLGSAAARGGRRIALVRVVSLTGGALLGLVIVLTVLAFAAAVALGPRHPGWRPLAVAIRVGSVGLVNLLVLLTAGLALNDTYGFYADWTDLGRSLFGGRLPTSSAQYGVAAPSSSASGQPATLPPVSAAQSARGVPTGRAVSFTVSGSVSGLRARVLVTLPSGYHDAANANRRYPVVETFPGYVGYAGSWNRNTPLAALVRDLAAQRRLAPTITVSPTVEFPAGIDNECVNGPPGQPQVETWLTRDIPAWVTAHFRVDPRPAAWATIGYSAGGWCAAMATMLHPQQYGAAIVLGGYFAPHFFSAYQPFTDTSPQWRRYDLVSTAASRPPPVQLWVETATADHVSYDSTRAFLRSVRGPTSVRAVTLQHAGHRFAVWNAVLPDAIAWLGHSVSGFAP